MTTHDLVVIGGGVAGLTIAWEAARAGLDVVVCETGDETGGMLRRGTVAGVDVDLGAESFATRTSGVVDLVADARLPVQFAPPKPAGAHLAYRGALGRTRRAPLPRRALIGLPADPAAPDVARILGRAGTRRAAQERSLAAVAGAEPSLADLATLRYGAAVTTRLVEPLCRSVYSQDAASVRLSALHPALWAEFAERGSLTAAVDALAPATRAGSAVRGIEGGLWRLAAELQAVALRAGAVIRTGTAVREIRSTAGGTLVVVDGETLPTRNVVVATGPAAAARLLGVDVAPAAPVRLTVAEITAPRLAAAPVGSGVIVAPDVDTPAKALTHVDAKWEWAAAALPAGTSVVRLSARDGVAGGLDTPAAVARAVRTLTGVAVSPGAVRSLTAVTWPDAVCPPATRIALTRAAADRGIRLAGAVAAGTGLASVIPHARALAADLIAHPTPHEGARHVR
ncbi:NAD(P)/FAD-dependent oxidoreductase [Microbacterium sp. 179-B 1A2 NHS]|uniref:protoporphyrinogen/coproporphyrinogen oxidase n=1 Tax=Microbacterium sp. 179-B 1A2 NHS TaxID=3142383 RepID=UPI00399F35D7